MEKKIAGKRLSREEMFDIFENDAYESYREHNHIIIARDNEGKRYTDVYPPYWYASAEVPLIHKYILADQVLNCHHKGEDAPPWYDNRTTFSHNWDLAFAFFLLHPLVWAPSEEYHNDTIYGYKAVNYYDNSELQKVKDMLNSTEQMRVLCFADTFDQPIAEDIPELGYIKGLHVWSPLTDNAESVFNKILNGEEIDDSDWQKVKRYDAQCLRNRIQFIASARGCTRAAKIIRLLQSEWTKMKVWKYTLAGMSEKEINEFEECLYHGFDDLLDEWESGDNSTQLSFAKEDYFPLLTDNCYKEGKMVEVENALREACHGTAPDLWAEIRTQEALGYIKSTKLMSTAKVYREFSDYFGNLPYKERNFREARGKA